MSISIKDVIRFWYWAVDHEAECYGNIEKSVKDFFQESPTPSVEPVDKKFYCKEWNNVGYVCEEQCAACKKHDQPTPEELSVDYEAESRIVFSDDMMPETDAPTINALRHGFVKARQMSVPTNDQRKYDLIEHLKRQITFSTRAFGPDNRWRGVVDHIRQELKEIEQNPDDLIEWVDVILLALDGAWRIGKTPEEIVAALDWKLTKNENREWPDWSTMDTDKAINHDRSKDELTQQKEMDGKVTRGNMLSEIVGSFPDLEYKKDAPINPLKAREIAEKAMHFICHATYLASNRDFIEEKMNLYLDTEHPLPIEKEGDDKADNQE